MADIQSNIRVNIDTNSALASLKVLQAQISAFHQQMGRSGALAASEMSKLQNGFMNAVNRSGQFDASMKTIKSTTESFTEALEKNKMSIGQYFRYAGAATKDFGKFFGKEFDTINKVARERVKDLQTQYIKLGRDANGAMKAIAVRPLVLDMDNLSTKTQIAAQKQQLLNQLLKQGSTNMLNWGKNTQWAGRQLMVGFTVPLTMLGQIASKTFMDMEQQVIKFQRVYGDLNTTTAETVSMSKQVTELAKTFTQYGVAVSDTMSMAADAAAMGKQGADLLAQVQSATTLSVLGGVDQQKALQTTISLTNAFGISADQLKNKINFLNAVENQSVLSIDDMTAAIPKAAPVIKQLGGNVEDLTFFLTAMKEGGVNAAEGANAIKSGLASIINPTKKASDMLAGFGINIKGLVQKDKGNVRQMVIDLGNALNKLDPLKRAQAIEQLFGKFQFSRISTLLKNVTDVNSQASKVADLANQGPEAAAVLAQRELKKISDSPMFKFKKALEDLKVELIPLGEQFLKAVTPIAQAVKDGLKWFNSLGDGIKNALGGTTMIVAGIGPVILMVVGLIANGIANLIKGFVGVKNFLNGLGKSTMDLGSQTKYMTQEQLDAAAVAASLEQSHAKLQQRFTAEAGAVALLRAEMEKAVAIQGQFGWSNGGTPSPKRTAKTKKFATGGVVEGPGGPTDDAVPANLSNGEVVLSVDTVKKNSGVISALLSGKKISIPGFKKTGMVGQSVPVRTHMSMPFAPGTAQYQEGLDASGFGALPEKLHKYISVVSNLVVELPHSLNILLENGTASIDEFSKTWSSRAGKLYETARKGGANTGDPLILAAIDGLDKQIHDKAIELAKGGFVSDPILAQAANDVIESQVRSLDANTAKAAAALKNRKDSIGQVRFSMPTEEARNLMRTGEAVKNPKTTAIEVNGVGIGRLSKSALDAGKSELEAKYYGANPYRPVGGYSGQQLKSVEIDPSEIAVPKQQGKKTAKSKSAAFDAGLIEEGQIQSPSKVTKAIGANYGKGFIIGAQEGLKQQVISPASMQHAQDQMKKIMKPFVDSEGIVNVKKLNDAYMVQVHVLTENEKALRQGIQMMRVARMPQEMFWKAIDKTGQVAAAVGTSIKTNAIKAFETLKAGAISFGNTVRDVAFKMQTGTLMAGATGNGPLSSIGQRLSSKWNDQYDKKGNLVKEGWKTKLGNNFKGGGAAMGVMMGMGALTQIPGGVGEVAQGLMGPVSAAATAMSLIPGPAGLAVGGIAALAIGAMQLKAAFDDAQNKAVQFAKSTGASADAINGIAQSTGKVTASETMDMRRQNEMSAFKFTSKQNAVAEQYVSSEAGKASINSVLSAMKSGGSQAAINNLVSQMSSAVATGAINAVDAKAIIQKIGAQIGDSTFSMSVIGRMDEMVGPDGSKIQNDAIGTRQNILAQGSLKNLKNSAQNLGNTSMGTEGFSTGLKIGAGAGAVAGSFIPGVGTLVGGALGGLIGGISGSVADMVNYFGNIATQSGEFAANLVIAEQNSQQMVDSLQLQYEQRIANAKAAGNEAEAERLIKEYQQGRLDILKQTGSALSDAAQNYSNFTTEKKTAVIGSLDTQIQDLYKEGPMKDIAKSAIDKIGAQTSDGSQAEMIIKSAFAAKQLDPQTLNNTLDVLKQQIGGNDSANLISDLITKSGGTEANRMMNIANMASSGQNQAAALQAFAGMDVTQQEKSMSTLDRIAQFGGEQSLTLTVDTLGADGAIDKLTSLQNQYDTLDNLFKTKGPITLEMITKTSGFEDVKMNAAWFNKLPKDQQRVAMNAYLTVKETIDANTSEGKARIRQWYEKKHGNSYVLEQGYVSYADAANEMANDAAKSAVTAQQAQDAAGGAGGGGGGGGAAKTATDKANAALSILGRKEESINKAYDKRLKALQDIQAANEKINQQKKDELDLADALSRGDIGAAAKAQQQAQQNAQQQALQDQQDRMNAARDAQIASLRVNGMSKDQLDAFIARSSNKSDSGVLGGWHLSTGGMVPNTQYFALGGKPRGTDTIAAMLTPGEFVIKKSAVDRLGAGVMHKINHGELPGGNSVYNYSISVNVRSDSDADQIAQTVIAKIKTISEQGMKGNKA